MIFISILLDTRQQRSGYLSLDVWPARQARNAAAACSRSSALVNLRRGCFGGGTATDVAPLMSSTPCRRMRLRCFIRDQFVRPDITHFLATRALQSKAAGENNGKAGGFALAPQTMCSPRRGRRTGGKRQRPGPTRLSYTRAIAVSADDRPLRREAAFSHGNRSRVRELTFREEHLARRGGAKMKIWPIAVASLIFGWAILQDRRHSVRELYRAHDRRRRH